MVKLSKHTTDPALSRSYKVIPEFGTACFAWFTDEMAMIFSL